MYYSRLLILQIIDEQVLCVHGGLSPEVRTVDQVSISHLHKSTIIEGIVPLLYFCY